jgi:molecular chaperone DnaK
VSVEFAGGRAGLAQKLLPSEPRKSLAIEELLMAYILLDFFQKQGLKLLESSLRGAEGQPCSLVREDRSYRLNVIQRGWFGLPLPLRMLGRLDLRWDDFYLELRDKVYDLSGETVALQPDLPAKILEQVQRYYGHESSLPAKVGGRIPQAIPLATPVAKLSEPVTKEGPSRNAETPSIPVGIDLGTTYSVIAYLDSQGRPCSIPNAAGDILTPSVVLFEEGGTIVGKEAVQASAMAPDQVAECVKRDMGAKVYRKKLNGEYLPPEVISSLILRSLKADAERKLGRVRQAVITVPAYFEEARRRATMDAGRLAGLEVLDIINEPTAAAIAYGYQLGFLDKSCRLASDQPLRVLVYDLGGGTFDVTILEIQGNSFKALATDGDVSLGGKDWDQELIDIAARRFHDQFREDPRANPVSLQELSLAAEAAKRALTERQKVPLFVNHLGSRLKVEVTRQEFEEATAALLERTRLTAEIVVRQAGLTWSAIDRVLLVGGATRMPMVLRMLEELTGKAPDRSISADEAVAHGAALYANLLAPRKSTNGPAVGFSVTNINSHSLGILGADPKTGRKLNKILLPKNSPLPRTVTEVFTTFKSNQRSVVIKVLEGESDRPDACSKVGTCAIRNLPRDLPAGWPVQVSYTYEANGRLHVAAKLKGHNAGVTTDFVRENSMPDDDLELWAHYVAEEMHAKN